MCNKTMLVIAAILSCGLGTAASASGIGATIGVGRIFLDDDGYTGLSASIDGDIGIGPYLSVSPTLGFWIHNEELLGSTVSMTDIIPAVGFKLHLGSKESVVAPYIGIQPEYHLMSASVFGYSTDESYFGASALAGVAFRATPTVSVPIQFSYGLIFYDQDKHVSDMHLRVGLLFNLQSEPRE